HVRTAGYGDHRALARVADEIGQTGYVVGKETDAFGVTVVAEHDRLRSAVDVEGDLPGVDPGGKSRGWSPKIRSPTAGSRSDDAREAVPMLISHFSVPLLDTLLDHDPLDP